MSFERLPYGMPPHLAEDLNHQIGIEIAFEQRRRDDLERAQAEAAYRARQAQQPTGDQQQPADIAIPQTSVPLFDRKDIVDRPNVHQADFTSVMPEVAYPQEEYAPIIEGRRGSYGKAVATVVAVGGLVLGGIFMANQENTPKTEVPATDTAHELAYDCRITSAKRN